MTVSSARTRRAALDLVDILRSAGGRLERSEVLAEMSSRGWGEDLARKGAKRVAGVVTQPEGFQPQLVFWALPTIHAHEECPLCGRVGWAPDGDHAAPPAGRPTEADAPEPDQERQPGPSGPDPAPVAPRTSGTCSACGRAWWLEAGRRCPAQPCPGVIV
jgi:hypothetical protein